MYLQETFRGYEKPQQKTAKRKGKIEETWVGTRQAQKLKLNFFYLFIYLFNLLFELNLHHTKRIHITT